MEGGSPKVGRKRALSSASNDNERQIAAQNVHLTCPICMEIYNGIIYQCKEGHPVCGKCYIKLPLPKKCPYCTIPLEGIRNRIAESMSAEIIVKCKWKNCEHVCRQEDMRVHSIVCIHRENLCCDENCEWMGYPDKLEEHWKTVHGKDTIYLSGDTFKFDMSDEKAREGGSLLLEHDGWFFGVSWMPRSEIMNSVKVSSFCGGKKRFTATLHEEDDEISVTSTALKRIEVGKELIFCHELEEGAYVSIEFY